MFLLPCSKHSNVHVGESKAPGYTWFNYPRFNYPQQWVSEKQVEFKEIRGMEGGNFFTLNIFIYCFPFNFSVFLNVIIICYTMFSPFHMFISDDIIKTQTQAQIFIGCNLVCICWICSRISSDIYGASTWFYRDGHPGLKGQRAGQLRSVVDVHAQVVANVVGAVPPRSLLWTKRTNVNTNHESRRSASRNFQFLAEHPWQKW